MNQYPAIPKKTENYHHFETTTNANKQTFGKVIACSGAFAKIAVTNKSDEEVWQVGCLISIIVKENLIIGLITSMEIKEKFILDSSESIFLVNVELIGELSPHANNTKTFSRGVSQYPPIGALAYRIKSDDMKVIYNTRTGPSCIIGKMSHDQSIDATVNLKSILTCNFAIFGSTGAGKSSAVSLILHKAIENDPRLRVLILDPHNEFSTAFHDMSITINLATLELPFWFMRLEEFCEVLFRGKPTVPEEIDALYNLIPEAKKMFRNLDTSVSNQCHNREPLTADTPIPYRMSDLLMLIDQRIGKLEGRNERPFLKSLKMRIVSIINDPLYRFMFPNNTINDSIMEVISRIFRIPGDRKPISILVLSDIPPEVANSIISVLCRMALEISTCSNNALHLLIICEEAHRYISADLNTGFWLTRQAIGRIAREGRKYSCSLGIITQQPSELDKTILSQCSTVFAMRLTNISDHQVKRASIPNSSLSRTEMLSSICNSEAIAFGEGIIVPMQIRFSQVPQHQLPKAHEMIDENNSTLTPETLDLYRIIEQMRHLHGENSYFSRI